MLWAIRKRLALWLIGGRPFVANANPGLYLWVKGDGSDPEEVVSPDEKSGDSGQWVTQD